MTTESRLYTYEEAAAAGTAYDKWELVEGRIVPMTFPQLQHVLVVAFLFRVLDGFAMRNGVGRVLTEMGLLTRRHPDSLRGPDLLFISHDRIRQIPGAFLTVMPELVIEVKSPDNSWRDLHEKAREYLKAGVDRVWNVDTHGKRVRVYTSTDEYIDLSEDDDLRCDGLLTGLVIAVREIIASAEVA